MVTGRGMVLNCVVCGICRRACVVWCGVELRGVIWRGGCCGCA